MNSIFRALLLTLGFTFIAVTAVLPRTASACGPADSGSPCGGAGVASQGNSSGTNQGAGNPINVITGNKYEHEVDMPALPGVLGLELGRYYNSTLSSLKASGGTIGRGWRLSYETRLYPVGNTLQIMQADGTRIIFERNPQDPSLCATRDPAHGTIRTTLGPDGVIYIWTWPNGRKFAFDAQGKLTHIQAPTGEVVSLDYNPENELIRVTDPEGRSLTLHYADRAQTSAKSHEQFHGVQYIDSPVGRFTYGYGSTPPKGYTENHQPLKADLVSVTNPKGVSRRYVYEDARYPTLLTGIIIDSTKSAESESTKGKGSIQRIRTWAYDAKGRGILSVLGKPRQLDARGAVVPGTGIGQVNIDYTAPTTTTLTNSLGQKTTYTYTVIGNEHRLLSVKGAGCSSCGETNVRYGYDPLGRLVEKTALSETGQPLQTTHTTRDRLGRVVRISRNGYQDGKPQPDQLLVRYTYSDQAIEPDLIARPSVVPGKEFVTHITYNTEGQPTEVTESGFSPIDAKGRPQPTALTRTTTYTYQTIHGHSLLAQIDGPLPDGPTQSPVDSDITQFEWDKQGEHLSQITYPMNRTVRMVYDEQGRPRTITRQFANEVRREVIHYSAFGQVTTLSEEVLSPNTRDILARRTQSAHFNAENRLVQITWPDQSQTRINYNAAGHPRPIPLTGGQVLRFLPQSPNNEALQSGEIHPLGRIKELETTWGKPGTAAQDQVLQFTANGKTAERRLDDFGRVVAIKNPGQGWQTARYDAADHLIEKTDPLGNRSHAKYDLAGRLIRVMHTADGAKTPEQTISLHWLGPRLSEETVSAGDAHGPLLHSTRRSYTLWGQLASEQVTIPTTDQAHPVRMQRHLYYSTAGRLLSQTLPNGQRLAYRYYAANDKHPDIDGQLAEIDLISWPSWLDSWFTQLPESSQPKTVLAHFTPHAASQVTGRDQVAAQPPQIHAGLGTDAPGQQFDAAGLPHRLDTDKGNLQLIWNAAGQLVAVNDSAGHRLASYTYDAQGRRASSRTAQGATYFFYAGTQLLATATQTTEGHTRITGEYVYEGYRPIAWLKPKAPIKEATELMADLDAPLINSTAYALETDQRGAVQAVTTLNADPAQRQTLWQSRINAWGAVTPEGDAQFDPHLRLVNQYADAETGLSYNLARYYDPKAGRYISPDPSGITDSIDSQTPPSLKLDTTAYVSGQPLLYFDPDGAAKIRYYAITTGATGNSLGQTQGFTKARWAFVIYDIQGGGDPTTQTGQIRNMYAATDSRLLFDGGGNFVGGADDPMAGTTNPTNTAIKWEGQSQGSQIGTAFKKHYGDNLISIPKFTIENVDDDKASMLIWYLMSSQKDRDPCKDIASTWLPEINFSPEETPIKVSSAANGDAHSQRIVACGQNSSNDIAARRISKYNYAAMLLESSPPQINKDCSKNGCPGHALDGTVLSKYHASYGRTQFLVRTMLDKLQDMHNDPSLSSATRALLRLDDPAIWPGAIATAAQRVIDVGNAFDKQKATSPDWAKASRSDRNAFKALTGLQTDAQAEKIWNAINSWKRHPKKNLNNEAKNAIISTVILSDPTMNQYLMGIFKDSANDGAFNQVSKYLMQQNYDRVAAVVDQTNTNPEKLADGSINPAWQKRQRAIEIELAARVARLHNGDLCKKPSKGCHKNVATTGTMQELMTADSRKNGRQYATRFLNIADWPVTQPANPRRQQPTGDYFSLRCASKLPQVVTRGGMQMKPLKLN